MKNNIVYIMKYFCGFLVVIFSFQSVEAQMNSEIEASYAGGYTKSDMETASQLMILRTILFATCLWEVRLI